MYKASTPSSKLLLLSQRLAATPKLSAACIPASSATSLRAPSTPLLQARKTEDKSENDPDVHAGESPIAGINIHSNKKTFKSCVAITDDIQLRAERLEMMASRAISAFSWSQTLALQKVAQSSLSFDTHTDTKEKIQTKILSKVKSTKDNIIKLFKTTGRVSPPVLDLSPVIVSCVQRGVQDIHPSRSLTSISLDSISRVRIVTVSDSHPSWKTRLEVITSLVANNRHATEENVDGFCPISRYVAEVPSLSSPAQLPTVPVSQRTFPSTVLSNELPTIEEEVGDPEIDTEVVHTEAEIFTASKSCGTLTTKDSEARYDAMLAAEFATFSFNSNDIQEWSDDVEMEKQAKMDSYFAYVSEALAVPVPRLFAHFATIDKDELASVPSPIKTDISEMFTSSADSSLVTSVDTEEDRPQPSPVILRGLRRVRSHEDLRNLQSITDYNDLGPSSSPVAGS